MIEIETDRKWLYETLSGDATLAAMLASDSDFSPAKPAVYDGIIPQSRQQTDSTKYPAVLFQMATEIDSASHGAVLRHTERDFFVFGIKPGESYPTDIADRIKTLLHGKTVLFNSTIVSCIRIAPYEAESHSGKDYRSSGGRYRISVSHPVTP